jgi:hypothetical protein
VLIDPTGVTTPFEVIWQPFLFGYRADLVRDRVADEQKMRAAGN